MGNRTPNRWLIAIAGVVMQIGLGAVYAWSVFRDPLVNAFGWTISQVTLTFSITIFTLGCAAFFGGLWMARSSPRTVGVAGGLLYGLGVFFASFSANNLLLLYLTYGVLGGIGIGLGYIVPVATLVKWFPDKRGLITGVAVGGFGLGSLLTAPIARYLIVAAGVLQTFAILGVLYLILVVGAALFMQNPPVEYRPPGWNPATAQGGQAARDWTLGEAVRTWQWYALWALLFLNVTAGISIISQAAPMVREITGVTAAVAAGFAGFLGLPNGIGRFLWAWLSDFVGRRWVFVAMFLLQAAGFVLMPRARSFVLFSTLAFVLLLCYGGGFGTMPAFAADYYGPANVGSIYGLMLTAWGVGGAFGPTLISRLRETTGTYASALNIIAGIMLISTIVPLIVRPPQAQASTPTDGLRDGSHDALSEREAGR
jgi:OFA family oxalate/formate antiporter-like MFS transporter